MKSSTLILPNGRTLDYQVRLSKRAKYMRMQLSPQKGLVVTQPLDIGEQQLTDWVHTKLKWISHNLAKLEAHSNTSHPECELTLPDHISLPAIHETIDVFYKPTTDSQLTAEYTDDRQLTLSGATDSTEFCVHLLQKWLQNYAKYHLNAQLAKVSAETGLHYASCRVKSQRTRWGSCSTRANVNLNYKLLMLPEEWMHYTLVHELCHTVEMNHSKNFWALVEQFVPNYKIIHENMKDAISHLPAWVEHRI